MALRIKTEDSFVADLNAHSMKKNTNAIGFALIALENDDNRIDFEELITKYIDNPRLEKVLDIINPFENEKFEQLFIQNNMEEAKRVYEDFVSLDGYSEVQRIITDKLFEEDFFDLSYALAVNERKALFAGLNPEYVKNKMRIEDIKAVIASFEDTIVYQADGRTLNDEAKVFRDIANKSTSEANVIVAFKCFQFAIDCKMSDKPITEAMSELKAYHKIADKEFEEIRSKLSGNKREVDLLEYAGKLHQIQENMEKRQNPRKVFF